MLAKLNAPKHVMNVQTILVKECYKAIEVWCAFSSLSFEGLMLDEDLRESSRQCFPLIRRRGQCVVIQCV